MAFLISDIMKPPKINCLSSENYTSNPIILFKLNSCKLKIVTIAIVTILKRWINFLRYLSQNLQDYFPYLVEETSKEQKAISNIEIFLATNIFPVLN